MSEQVYTKLQIGRETTLGTSVAATTVFPVDTGFLGFELDRASETPDEDFGNSDRNQSGRASTGLRAATASVPFVCRFQDFMHPLEMHVAGSVTPTGGPTYVYTYPYDSTSDSLKRYTMEYGDENSTQDEWEAVSVICNELELGFDALSAPGNSMWKGTAGLIAVDRVAAAMTGSISPPATLETMEGHLTTMAEGGVGTAFASLSALTGSLKAFTFNGNLNKVIRAYGGATDIGTAYGVSGKGEGTVEALVKVSATTKTDFLDIYAVAGSIPTERRWRITVTGTSPNVMTLDLRGVFRAVDIGEHEGERLYLVKGDLVRDATLASRATFILTNLIASVP